MKCSIYDFSFVLPLNCPSCKQISKYSFSSLNIQFKLLFLYYSGKKQKKTYQCAMVEVRMREGGAVPPVDVRGNIIWKRLYKNLNWDVVPFLLCQHVFCLIGLWAVIFPISWTYCTGISAPTSFTLVFAVGLWPISGLGVTAGMHRLWTHRSYEAHLSLRIFLMILASISNQSTIWGWAHVHRAHHQFSDTPKDPHNRRYGFFYTHIGWIISYLPHAASEAIRGINMDDLADDPVQLNF